MRVPILVYHAGNVAGGGYGKNDHVAFASDLAMFTQLGWRVVPLLWLVDQHHGLADRDLSNCLALTCDDGTDLDFRDVDYPGMGMQRGFLGCMQDAVSLASGSHPDMHMSAFVIADPEARQRMDRKCLHGLDWMREDWWARAQASGMMAIECHSWDHNHEVLAGLGTEGMKRGDFHQVNTATRAESQIDRAVHYLNRVLAPKHCQLFAFPYGHANPFLTREYLPARGPLLGLRAALGVQGEPVTMASDIWHLPRYVCGWHWRSPGELANILAECAWS